MGMELLAGDVLVWTSDGGDQGAYNPELGIRNSDCLPVHHRPGEPCTSNWQLCGAGGCGLPMSRTGLGGGWQLCFEGGEDDGAAGAGGKG